MSDVALVVLEDGHVFRGRAWGASGCAVGPLVIDASVSGYEAALLDENNRGKLVVCASPHVGNVGVSRTGNYVAAGLIARERARVASNHTATGCLDDALTDQAVVAVTGIDTRALIALAREGGVRAGIFSGDALPEAARDLDLRAPIPRSILDKLVRKVCE